MVLELQLGKFKAGLLAGRENGKEEGAGKKCEDNGSEHAGLFSIPVAREVAEKQEFAGG